MPAEPAWFTDPSLAPGYDHVDEDPDPEPLGWCCRCHAPLFRDGPELAELCDDCNADPELECGICGGSGGGPDGPTRCPSCRGSGIEQRRFGAARDALDAVEARADALDDWPEDDGRPW